MQARAGDFRQSAIQKLAMQRKTVRNLPSPGLDLTHGFMKKIQQAQMENRRQLALKNAGVNPSNRPAGSQRSTKPDLEIYRPPGARIAEMQRQGNGNSSVFDTDYVQCKTENSTTYRNPVAAPTPGVACSEFQDFVPAVWMPSAAHEKRPAKNSQLQCHYGDSKESALTHSGLVGQAMQGDMWHQSNGNSSVFDADYVQCDTENGTTNQKPVAAPTPWLPRPEVQDFVPAVQTPSAVRDGPPSENSELPSHYRDDEEGTVQISSLVRQAMHDPTKLSSKQLEGLAFAICHTGTKSVEHAKAAAHFCYRIAMAAHNVAFVEHLLASCHKLFGRRVELMRQLEAAENVHWTPYVTLVANLLLKFESFDFECARGPDGSLKSVPQQLAFLLSSCFDIILRTPTLGSITEMECLRTAMTASGQAMQHAEPHLMCMLIVRLRDAFVIPSVHARSRMVLLELIELHASGWQMSPAQQMYYNPSGFLHSHI